MRNLISCAGQCSRQWRFRQSNPARAPLSRFPSDTCESLWVQRRHTSRRSRRRVDAFCAALVLHEIRWPGSVRGHDRLKADQSSYTLSRNRLRPFWGGIVVTLTPLISDFLRPVHSQAQPPAPNGRTRRRANDDSPAWQPCRRNQTAQWPRSVIRTLQHSATFS
jgi:hypothetical protein